MGRILLRIIVVLAVLAGIGVAADAVVRMLAEDQAATVLRRQLRLAENPEVELGGFPFSMALVTRSVPSAQVDVATLPVQTGGHPLELTGVTATTGTIRQDPGGIVVDGVRGHGLLDYADLTELVGVPVSHDGSGRLKLEYRTELLGREVTASVSATPVINSSEDQLVFDEPEVSVAGQKLSGRVLDELVDRLVRPIDVSLEYGLHLKAVRPLAEGIEVEVAGTGLRFEQA